MEDDEKSGERRLRRPSTYRPLLSKMKLKKLPKISVEDIYLQTNFKYEEFTGTNLETIYESPAKRGNKQNVMGATKVKRHFKFNAFDPSKIKIKQRKSKAKQQKRLGVIVPTGLKFTIDQVREVLKDISENNVEVSFIKINKNLEKNQNEYNCESNSNKSITVKENEILDEDLTLGFEINTINDGNKQRRRTSKIFNNVPTDLLPLDDINLPTNSNILKKRRNSKPLGDESYIFFSPTKLENVSSDSKRKVSVSTSTAIKYDSNDQIKLTISENQMIKPSEIITSGNDRSKFTCSDESNTEISDSLNHTLNINEIDISNYPEYLETPLNINSKKLKSSKQINRSNCGNGCKKVGKVETSSEKVPSNAKPKSRRSSKLYQTSIPESNIIDYDICPSSPSEMFKNLSISTKTKRRRRSARLTSFKEPTYGSLWLNNSRNSNIGQDEKCNQIENHDLNTGFNTDCNSNDVCSAQKHFTSDIKKCNTHQDRFSPNLKKEHKILLLEDEFNDKNQYIESNVIPLLTECVVRKHKDNNLHVECCEDVDDDSPIISGGIVCGRNNIRYSHGHKFVSSSKLKK